MSIIFNVKTLKWVSYEKLRKLLRDIIKHMFAINYHGTLSYLKFDDIQQQVFDVIYS